MRYDFATPEPPKLRFGIGAGRVEVETADVAETTVEVEAIRGNIEDLKVEQHGRDIVVEGRKRFGLKSDRVRHPHPRAVRFRGRRELGVGAVSGHGPAEQARGQHRFRRRPGRGRRARRQDPLGERRRPAGSVGGRTDVNTASGDVQVDSAAGGGTIRSASGDVQIAEAAKQVKLQTASGDMLIGSIAEGSVDVKSASGDVRIGIKQGSRLHVDASSLSGDTTSDVELGGVEVATGGPLVEVKGTTMSGDIRIVRA